MATITCMLYHCSEPERVSHFHSSNCYIYHRLYSQNNNNIRMMRKCICTEERLPIEAVDFGLHTPRNKLNTYSNNCCARNEFVLPMRIMNI